jgi:hypothetical protein
LRWLGAQSKQSKRLRVHEENCGFTKTIRVACNENVLEWDAMQRVAARGSHCNHLLR